MDSSTNFSLGAGETCWTWFCNCSSITCWWLGIFYFLFHFLYFLFTSFHLFYLLSSVVSSLLQRKLYGLFKVLRACICGLCKKKDEEDGDIESESYEEEEESNKSFRRVWCPTIVYAVCWVFVLYVPPPFALFCSLFFLLLPLTSSFTPVLIVFCRTGMIFGLMNNPRFSDGTPTSPFSPSPPS